MPCKMFLRHNQVLSLREKYSTSRVAVFAPLWVKQALLILGTHFHGLTFHLHERRTDLFTQKVKDSESLETLTLTEDFNNQSLLALQKVARNEPSNVSGKINRSLYEDIKDSRVLYSLRDLVRQTVICGIDESSMYGGYRTSRHRQHKKRVYICDLAALQFQQPYNTGRLVLIQKSDKYKGIQILDDFIYKNVTGENKLSYDEVEKLLSNPDQVQDTPTIEDGEKTVSKLDKVKQEPNCQAAEKIVSERDKFEEKPTCDQVDKMVNYPTMDDILTCEKAEKIECDHEERGEVNLEGVKNTVINTEKKRKQVSRYLPCLGIDGEPCFLDTKAYSQFVQQDLLLCGKAFVTLVKRHYPDDKLHFKFLKYGTGFFAGKFSHTLEKLILPAVLDGIEKLFHDPEVEEVIRCVELPFYTCDPESQTRVDALKEKYKIEIIFGNNDAIKHSHNDKLLIATTNCGDNHAACGNEMNFGSVDAAIAENLYSKGNIFCPNINTKMTEEYVEEL